MASEHGCCEVRIKYGGYTLKYAVAKMGFLEKNGGLYVSTFQIGGIREKLHLKSKMKYYFNLF